MQSVTLVVVCFRFVLWRYLLQYENRTACLYLVVVCFRFVLWRYLLQSSFIFFANSHSCGLLSVCSLKIFITIHLLRQLARYRLWFAFGLFFEDIYYNWIFKRYTVIMVVVCFRFVLWRYLLQSSVVYFNANLGCGLLSVCSLKIFITICKPLSPSITRLWFAFGLFFEDIYYNYYHLYINSRSVVVCFRFVLWRYLLQYTTVLKSQLLCCGLLSVCSLKIFITIARYGFGDDIELWFAFGLFFEDIYYNLRLQ